MTDRIQGKTIAQWEEEFPIMKRIRGLEETVWLNEHRIPAAEAIPSAPVTMADVQDAADRLARFADYFQSVFPETQSTGGILESPLQAIPEMQRCLEADFGCKISGNLWIKLDSHLPISGSIKARGGIYEVLTTAERIALEHGLLKEDMPYRVFDSQEFRDLFSRYSIAVGSTGNLGLSIGIMSARIGYRAVIHMSADARQWKKDLLRSHGVTVIEYDGDYGKAVEQGRAISDADPMSYFVDDEHSANLFLGYSVAGRRLADQLESQGVCVDADHPLFVTIPCGVGGAPGGVVFGLKHVYGDNVHCFFVEPVQCPCMLAGMASGEGDRVCVQDFGLTGQTEADGLAVGRCSVLVADIMTPLLSGEFTLEDGKLFDNLRLLWDADGIFIEPSSCAAFEGFFGLKKYPQAHAYLEQHGLTDKMENAVHVLWATGGSLVPQEIRAEYLEKRL